MIKAVIFDSDGMLSHGPRFSDTYANDTGIPVADMVPFFTGPFAECLIGKADLKEELVNGGWLQKWNWEGTVDAFLKYWFSVGDELDGTVFATIQALRDREILTILATNQEKYRTAYLSTRFGYDTAFDKVFSSAHTGYKKPSPEFFGEIVRYLQERDPSITKEDILFWDDDSENIEGARAFGIRSEQFTDTKSYIEKMEELSLI